MKKRLLYVIALLFFIASSAIAQNRTVTGTVKAKSDGGPIPAVSVVIKNTTIGTQTDLDGKFSLSVPSGATLVFKSIGFAAREITLGTASVINVTLEDDSKQLGEVVVTALGISKEKKALGYSATAVKGEDLNRTSPVSMMDGLQGKVAGAEISSQSGAPGASSKVILRGYASLTGNNQPLYVVDGVPINNTASVSALGVAAGAATNNSVSRTTDFGNGANDINPNDIESMSILKGAAATSLYGSRASSGVIIITTKSGKAGKAKIDFNSSSTFSEVLFTPTLQSVYGQGWSGTYDSQENGSWGPKLDGAIRPWGNTIDGTRLTKPFVANTNRFKDFYTTGNELNNSLAISGGTDKNSFYLSYGNINSDGIIPTNIDSYKRNTLALRGTSVLGDLKVSASLNYVNRDAKAVSTGQGTATGATLFQELIQVPVDININSIKDYHNVYNNVDNFYTPYAQNPFFTINENGNNFSSERFYGNTGLDYKFANWLSAAWKVGFDVTDSKLRDWQAVAAPKAGSNNASKKPFVGGVQENNDYRKELNTDLMLNFDQKLSSDFSLNGLVGVNVNERDARIVNTRVEGLILEGFYDLSNSANAPAATSFYSKRRLVGTYAQANLSFKDYLYLTLNARNDWSSTLPKDKNSFFYPGANVGFVVTDAFKNLQGTALSFAKIRASIGKTGNDAGPYSIANYLTAGSAALGFGQLNFPLNGVGAFEVSNIIGNPTLRPELTTEYELGADLRFLKNRVGIDFAFYNKTTKDQILAVPVSAGSGYTSRITNFGKIENKGIEVALNLTPIKGEHFTWEATYTYAKNQNTVLELPNSLKEVVLNTAYGVDMVAIVGQPLGVIKGHTAKTSPDGKVIVNATTGIPLVAQDKVAYGDINRKFSMGLSNKFTYDNWALGFSFDFRKGGLMYSYTSRLNYFVGNAVNTLLNDRRPFLVPNSVNEVVATDGTVTYVENSTAVGTSNIANYFNQTSNNSMSRNNVIDKSFIKMRDITLSYQFPKSLATAVKAQNASLSVYGRNLFVWVPKGNSFIDPEVSTFSNDLAGEFGEFGGGPSVRSFGVSLKVGF
ncbi:SusC/RagA family TonB-linked outer membrane protein [Solitalea koreensis]|uniref:TonB-linked outer membrane protein, SusC/RagA family n=1 Tax=Solitalea koreensis TaxID=543615 RepID=A0A521C7L5_9SPHI|nr:SusC/RagA family TonB-linked outer membrane protein [Solitalea koreensis]SMO55373.1 TonB-linked outer membrane protein, SusC/RagA family [Solitalea koreensis]